MNKDSKIYVAGHRGLVGSAILHNLQQKGYTSIVLRTHAELDLVDQQAVDHFFATEKPDYVFLAAAHVGGIWANAHYRADFIYQNLMIQNNVIHAAYTHGVKKLLFLGSTCIYPGEAPQPMPEDCLLTSALEYTNEPYAIAKIAGIKMCESYNLQYGTNFVSIMPTNLYGLNDNFDLERSHVLPAMLRKIHLAHCLERGDWQAIRSDLNKRPIEGVTGESPKEEQMQVLTKYGISASAVVLWGTGKPLREFLWSEDMADASVFIMEKVDFSALKPLGAEVRNTHINVGTGVEHRIQDLAALIKEVIGFGGELRFDATKPDGTLRKLTDVTKLHRLGWRHTVEIEKGVERLYQWYCLME
ncbi:GDP-L-fucose synthase [Parabacteroides sp. 52]|uniref:GDP-L-fucose synthase family protein n=1 Tax=unclassified Parabacteroides TaxID=2649774 RepID=UPI0013D05851|nr:MULTISPECIES: GDP-L-fucose synthase [unclassified Parabacteroides]MDH6533569.1 GDP-L-fucose synthase [Parabacteroides sp. PM5-20]NDV54321.1 GDP-L-fucose synthase [Parabacteroides sp. 52]